MGPPVWTSDSKELVFRSSRAGRGGLWTVSVAGGTPVRIALAGIDAREPAIAGSRLTYVLGVRPSNRCDSHDAFSCALTMPVIVGLGDGRVGVRRVPAAARLVPPLVRRRDDRA